MLYIRVIFINYLQKVVFKFKSQFTQYPGQLLFWIMLLLNEISGSNFFFWRNLLLLNRRISKYLLTKLSFTVLQISLFHEYGGDFERSSVFSSIDSRLCADLDFINCCFTIFLFFHLRRTNLHFWNFNLANIAVEIKFQLFMFIRTR